MKFKLQAGAELDLLTRGELREELQAWRSEIARGVKFRTFHEQTNVAAGVFSIGMGPAAGFVWAVTRIAVSGNGIVLGTDAFAVYAGEVSATTLVGSGYTRQATWDVPVLTISGPRQLVVTGAGTGVAGTDVFVSGAAVEVPEQLAWQLV